MKKIIAISLVAIMAVGSVFAAFSGSATLAYTHNFDTKDSGFSNGTNVVLDLDYATAEVENIGEGDIYGAVKATLGLKLYNGADGSDVNDIFNISEYADIAFFVGDITATIGGDKWSLDLITMPGRLDLAKSAIDSSTVSDEDDDYGKDKADYTSYTTYAVPYNKAPGFGFTYADYTVGLGFQYKDKNSKDDSSVKYNGNAVGLKSYKGFDFSAVVKTPEIAITDEITLQAGASYYLNQTAGAKMVTDETKKGPDTKKFSTNRGQAVGGSAAFAYATDIFGINVATDLGYTIDAYKVDPTAADKNVIVADAEASKKFSVDVAGNITYDFLSADGYFKFDGATAAKDGKRKASLVSGQIATDLNSFEVPVKVTASVKDILKTVDLGLEVETTPVTGLTLTVSGGYVVDTVDAYAKEKPADTFMGQWSTGLDAEYEFEQATIAAGISLKNVGYADADDAGLGAFNLKENETVKDVANKVLLGLSASVKTTTLVPGAELKLAWSDADDLLKVYQYNDDHANFGKITASAKVSF